MCVCSKPMVNWLIEFFFVLSVFLYFRFDNLFVRKLTLCFCFSHHYYWFFSINALWFMFNGTNFSIFFSIPESNKWKTKQTRKNPDIIINNNDNTFRRKIKCKNLLLSSFFFAAFLYLFKI